jgi:hypothetical protein
MYLQKVIENFGYKKLVGILKATDKSRSGLVKVSGTDPDPDQVKHEKKPGKMASYSSQMNFFSKDRNVQVDFATCR